MIRRVRNSVGSHSISKQTQIRVLESKLRRLKLDSIEFKRLIKNLVDLLPGNFVVMKSTKDSITFKNKLLRDLSEESLEDLKSRNSFETVCVYAENGTDGVFLQYFIFSHYDDEGVLEYEETFSNFNDLDELFDNMEEWLADSGDANLVDYSEVSELV